MKKKDTAQVFIEKVGKRVRQLRKKRGYTSHEDFAYEHDIIRSTMGRIERGADMRLSNLYKVLTALQVTPTEFFSEGFD